MKEKLVIPLLVLLAIAKITTSTDYPENPCENDEYEDFYVEGECHKCSIEVKRCSRCWPENSQEAETLRNRGCINCSFMFLPPNESTYKEDHDQYDQDVREGRYEGKRGPFRISECKLNIVLLVIFIFLGLALVGSGVFFVVNLMMKRPAAGNASDVGQGQVDDVKEEGCEGQGDIEQTGAPEERAQRYHAPKTNLQPEGLGRINGARAVSPQPEPLFGPNQSEDKAL